MTYRQGDPLFHQINDILPAAKLETDQMFSAPSDTTMSPLDEFIANTAIINTLAGKYTEGMPAAIASLVVLGYVSAIESYFRTLIRKLINLDHRIRDAYGNHSLLYSSVIHHKPTMLPEALLEETVFSNKDAIESAYKILASRGRCDEQLSVALMRYEKVCEIRHCCVHRFGRLGVKNARSLGIIDHKHLLEHAFTPSEAQIEDIATACNNVVLEFNRALFRELLKNIAIGKEYRAWTWKWQKDRPRFQKYYELFATSRRVPASPKIHEIYKEYARAFSKAKRYREATAEPEVMIGLHTSK